MHITPYLGEEIGRDKSGAVNLGFTILSVIYELIEVIMEFIYFSNILTYCQNII